MQFCFFPLMTFGCESRHYLQAPRDRWKLGFTAGSLWGIVVAKWDILSNTIPCSFLSYLIRDSC